ARGVSSHSKKLGARTCANVDEAVAVFGEPARPFFQPGVTYDHDAELAGRHDLASESILSVSGGGEGGLRYYVSGTWKHDPGIIANTGYDKQSVRLNIGKDLSDVWRVNVNSYLIHSVASRGVTNNDNSNTSFYIVLPFIPNFYALRRRPDRPYPPDPFISNGNNLNYNLGINLVHNWAPSSADLFATSPGGFQYESRDLNLVRVVGRNLVAGQGSLGAATIISVGQQLERVHDRGGYLQEELL